MKREISKNGKQKVSQYGTKVGAVDVVVGIPSYNEAGFIANTVRQIDLGLSKYFPNYSSVIINADNNSPDGTKTIFLNTFTHTPKLYLSSPENVRGKGYNVRNILRASIKMKAKSILLFDADIQSIEPEWVKKYMEALSAGYDFITPRYLRSRYDGSITANLVYPLTLAVWGKNIRQPIGGDFALTGSFASHLLKQRLASSILTYGIDIFLTSQALAGKYPIAQVYLGAKKHCPSLNKLDRMFPQVADVLFKAILSSRPSLVETRTIKDVPLLFPKKPFPAPETIYDSRYIQNLAKEAFKKYFVRAKRLFPSIFCRELEAKFSGDSPPVISSSFWLEALSVILAAYARHARSKEIILGICKAIFFARQNTFVTEISSGTDEHAEAVVVSQARFFFRNRKKFFRH